MTSNTTTPVAASVASAKSVTMKDVRAAVASIAKQGKKATLHDHIITILEPNEREDYNRALVYFKIVLSEKENSRLVGTLVFPSVRTRGAKQKWGGAAQPMHDTIPMPNWEWSPRTRALTNAIQSMTGEAVSYNTVKAFSNLSGRLGKDMAGTILFATNKQTQVIEDMSNNLKTVTDELSGIKQQIALLSAPAR